MTDKKDIKRLEQKIDDLNKGIKLILERQNSQYTDIMLQFKREPIDQRTNKELYSEALKAVLKSQKASTSFLQRKLKIGYVKAVQLIDLLEEKGIIGPGLGAKPREVLLKEEK